MGFAVGPTLFYAAMRSPNLTSGQRGALGTISLVTLVVDGYLLARWLAR